MDVKTAFDKSFEIHSQKESKGLMMIISAHIKKGDFSCEIVESQWMPENITNNKREELMTKYLEKIGCVGMKAEYLPYNGNYKISWKLGFDEMMAKFDEKIDADGETKIDAKIAEIAKQKCDVLEIPEFEKPLVPKSAYQFYRDEHDKNGEFSFEDYDWWTKMDSEQRAKYYEMEANDKARYDREIAEYEKNSQ